MGVYSEYILNKLINKLYEDDVTTIDFSDCEAITGYALDNLNNRFHHLKKMNLKNCINIDDRIFNNLANHRFLEYIDLENCTISDFGVQTLCDYSHLKILNISKCLNVTNKSIEFLSPSSSLLEIFIRSCPNITSEGIEYFHIGILFIFFYFINQFTIY